MKNLLEHADEIPVTLVLAVAYGTIAILSHSLNLGFAPSADLWAWGSLAPMDATLGEPWRLLSHAFVHANIVHLLFNLSFLFSLGPVLERSMGSLRFAVLYVVSALGGAIAVCLLYPLHQPVVGGSGALFGMMGAGLAWSMHSGRHMLACLDFEGPRQFVGMIVANLVIGWLIPFVSNTAHIGGLLAGFLVTLTFLAPSRSPTARRRPWQIATVALFAGMTFACVHPVWRCDYLWAQVTLASTAPQRPLYEALHRAQIHSPQDYANLRSGVVARQEYRR